MFGPQEAREVNQAYFFCSGRVGSRRTLLPGTTARCVMEDSVGEEGGSDGGDVNGFSG